MFIHGVTRQGTNEVGLRTVGKWERLGQGIEWLGTDRALSVMLLLLVALTGALSQGPLATLYN